ncbi:MAG: hypothetical protein HY521_00010 [Proteobacteria bacterium]|nr:hypothetical protein [Pseudomonadota bacterium]
MFRYRYYQKLAAEKDAFYAKVAAVARKVGMRDEWKGDLGLTGSNSARPAYLRKDIIDRIVEGATSKTNLVVYLEKIREMVKEVYGERYDALPISTCEAAVWVSLDTLASPPFSGRGDNYRSRYLALYESHAEHHLSYGRPFPPKYKDIFADRTNTAGELGIIGRRLANLDVLIVKAAGADYDVHGVRGMVTPLLTRIDPQATKARLKTAIERHIDTVSAVVGLGYDTAGYGYGAKADGKNSDLKKAMGDLAEEYDLPYIVDNARGTPFVGYHPADINAHVLTYSMDKVAGAITSGLIIGREDYMVPLRRAIGFFADRFGGGVSTYGKGAFIAFDMGREALVSQCAALEWILKNRRTIEKAIDDLYAITVEECAPVIEKYGRGIMIEKSYNGGGVELNYTRTWDGGRLGIPIFCIEDKAANLNLLSNAFGAMGLLPPSCDEGNITVTPGRGMLDADGNLIPERARVGVRAMNEVLLLLGDLVKE